MELAAAIALALVGVLGAVALRRRRRVWLAAFLEQGRREAAHRLEWRDEQRVTAIQQRLSRHIGKKAFSAKARGRIEKELRRHGLVD